MQDAEYQARVEMLVRELVRVAFAHTDTLSAEHRSQVAITAAFVLLGGLALERSGGDYVHAIGMLKSTPWATTIVMANDVLTRVGSAPARTP